MSNRNFKEKLQTIRKGTIFPVVTGLCLLIGISNAHAISNGGFEVGTFGSWDTIGITSIETAALGTGPTEGTYQAFLSNDDGSASQSSLESFLGLTSGALDTLVTTPSSSGATEGSAIKQTFSGIAGDILSFDWNFLTDDGPPGGESSTYNDSAFYTLNGQAFLLADTLGVFGPSSTGYIAETGFGSVSITLPGTGIYTLGFGVVDVGDLAFDSALLVDNVVTASPEPSTIVLLGTGLAGFLAWRLKKDPSMKG